MTDATASQPQRIGDAERDRAVEVLRDHLAEGRLDSDEFDERMSAALGARTADQLAPLFVDLPSSTDRALAPRTSPWTASPTPGPLEVARPAPVPQLARVNAGLAALSAIAWPAAVIICFATGWDHWWIMLLPLLLSGYTGKHGSNRAQRRHPDGRSSSGRSLHR